jgi:hypothetical protein
MLVRTMFISGPLDVTDRKRFISLIIENKWINLRSVMIIAINFFRVSLFILALCFRTCLFTIRLAITN